MLTLSHSAPTRLCDGLSRREFLRVGSLGLAGLTLPGLLKAADGAGKPRAKSVIVLFLSGGPSHLDTFDLKPNAPEEIRGTFRPLTTSVPGIQVCEHLPRTARVMSQTAVIRSMCHTTGNHPAATYWMLVGSPMTRPAPQIVTMSREDRPHPGAVMAKFQPHSPNLPAWVMVPEAISPVGPERPGQHAGFLGAAYDPYRVNSDPSSPEYSPGSLGPRSEIPRERLDLRRSLLNAVSRQARFLEESAAGQVLDPYFTRAFDLVSSPAAQEAFDISREPENVRRRYGQHIFGQSTLLARRLVEAGVRLVHVNWVRHDNGAGGQGYDSHRDHLNWSKDELLPPTDAAFASLIEDLDDRGLLEETLVLMLGEFGRTPRFNAQAGRDHWPWCFTVVAAGGGIRGGQVIGASDSSGAYPTSTSYSPQDLFATLYHNLGIDPHTLIHDLQNRPYPIVEGQVIRPLLA